MRRKAPAQTLSAVVIHGADRRNRRPGPAQGPRSVAPPAHPVWRSVGRRVRRPLPDHVGEAPTFRCSARPGPFTGKVEPTPEIEAAANALHPALDATPHRADQVALVWSGLADEQKYAPAAITILEAVLTRARPNATAVALGLDWRGNRGSGR